jgi:hypothetical protein
MVCQSVNVDQESEATMSTHDQGADRDGKGHIGRLWQRLTPSKPAEDCTHPHAHLVDADGSGEQTTVLVCAECGRPLDVGHDPTLRSRQHLSDAKVCVDCASTHWTLGTRRSL